MTQQAPRQQAMLTYGPHPLVPKEPTNIWGSVPANFEPKAIVIPGTLAMEWIEALDSATLDDEALDFSGKRQGQDLSGNIFVRCDLPPKERRWTTGKKYQLTLVSKTKVDAFQLFVIGEIPP